MLPCCSRVHLVLRRPPLLFAVRGNGQLDSTSLINSLLCTSLFSPGCFHSSYSPLIIFFSSFTTRKSESVKPDEISTFACAPTQGSIIYVLKKLEKMPQKALNFFMFATAQYGPHAGSSAYNLMLRILAHKGHITDFWSFLNSMQNYGYKLEEGTYCIILDSFKKQKLVAESFALRQFYSHAVENSTTDAAIKSAVKILLDAQGWSKEVEKELGDLKLSLSDDLIAKILRELRYCPYKALEFFRWVSQMPDYKHGSVAHNAMTRVLGLEESTNVFWSFVKEMKLVGHDMDIDTYIKITRQFLKRDMMKDAVELYEFMMDGPYKPAIQDCGMLLRQIALSPTPDLDLVFRVARKYELVGYSLSKVVYDGIHRSLTSTMNFDDAKEIMKKMRQEGFEPDNITYSQLVYGLCKAKRFDDACNVLDEMEKGGCIPDLKTWTILIQGHCSAGEVDSALECLTKMIEKKYNVDADLLDVLVKGLCSKNRKKGAHILMVEMIDIARVRPWQATFKYLIKELLEAGQLEEALKLLSLMKTYKFPPFSAPFAAYVSRFGTTEDAEELLKILSGKTFPSPETYLKLFEAFFEQGRYAEAHDLLFKCPHHIRKHPNISKIFGSVNGENAT